MKILWALAAVCVVTASCGGTDSATSTTSTAGASTTTSTTVSITTLPPVSTTMAGDPGVQLIGAGLRGIHLIQNGDVVHLEGDADYAVTAAFDDLAGGIVYQYGPTPEQYPSHSILRIPAGGTTPDVVLSAEPGRAVLLTDVAEVEGRTTLLYLEGADGAGFEALVVADLLGGAPRVVASVDPAAPPGDAGVTPTSISGGSLADGSIAVIWHYGDIEASCSYVEVLDLDGDLRFGPVPATCGETDVMDVELSPDGSRLALADGQEITVVDTADGAQLAQWSTGIASAIDFDGATVIATGTDTYTTLSLRGRAATDNPLPEGVTSLVTAGEPVDVAAGTFLGGVRPLSSTCSASGLPSTPEPQGGLPEAVAATRDAIVAAATGCDVEALANLTGESFSWSFDPAGTPGRFWRLNEQSGYGTLGRIVDVLALRYIVEDLDGRRLYVWPSAFSESPTDEDWQDLADVYNEEDIDLFKAYGGYIGMRVGITEDGTWLFAIEGD